MSSIYIALGPEVGLASGSLVVPQEVPRHVRGASSVLGLGSIWLDAFLINPIYLQPQIRQLGYLSKGQSSKFYCRKMQNT